MSIAKALLPTGRASGCHMNTKSIQPQNRIECFLILCSFCFIRPCIFYALPIHRGCDAPACFFQELLLQACKAADYPATAFRLHPYVR